MQCSVCSAEAPATSFANAQRRGGNTKVGACVVCIARRRRSLCRVLRYWRDEVKLPLPAVALILKCLYPKCWVDPLGRYLAII